MILEKIGNGGSGTNRQNHHKSISIFGNAYK